MQQKVTRKDGILNR